MRSKMLGVMTAAVALACGRSDRPGQGQEQPAQTPAPQIAAGQVIEVRMTGNSRNEALFEPAALTITPGTTLRFRNVSGGPHNVVFWPDSIPSGAAEVLNGAITNRQGNLASPYLVEANATYDLTFPATLPVGVYKGYCAPHLIMGMKLAITIQ